MLGTPGSEPGVGGRWGPHTLRAQAAPPPVSGVLAPLLRRQTGEAVSPEPTRPARRTRARHRPADARSTVSAQATDDSRCSQLTRPVESPSPLEHESRESPLRLTMNM